MNLALRPQAPRLGSELALTVVVGALLAAASVAGTIVLPNVTVLAFAGAGVVAVAVWMLVNPRAELTLMALLLYVTLVDGFARLKTGEETLTLVRDAFLYAIVLGIVVRGIVQRKPLSIPPMTAWVLAFTAVVLVQIPNPGGESWFHSLASVRPHLEWIPLFFLGYSVMRSTGRLRTLFVLLLVVAGVNGAVSYVQANLSFDQFASWGPGYEERMLGTGDVAGRYFVNQQGDFFVRPFGLGGDFGFGGALGLLALPGGLALLMLSRRGIRRLLYAGLTGAAVFAILMGAQRTAVVGAVISIFAFAWLATSRRTRALGGLLVTAAVGAAIAVSLAGGASAVLGRYESILPSRVLETTYEYRSGTLATIPQYVVDFPLGAGLGSVGPAASLVGDARKDLNSESQFTFLLVELGIPGLLLLLAFTLRLLALAWRKVRALPDGELRICLAALVAPLVGQLASWVAGPTTTTTPGAPYFWFAAGAIAYWAYPNGRPERSSVTAR
jgi:hypothetical protein